MILDRFSFSNVFALYSRMSSQKKKIRLCILKRSSSTTIFCYESIRCLCATFQFFFEISLLRWHESDCVIWHSSFYRWFKTVQFRNSLYCNRFIATRRFAPAPQEWDGIRESTRAIYRVSSSNIKDITCTSEIKSRFHAKLIALTLDGWFRTLICFHLSQKCIVHISPNVNCSIVARSSHIRRKKCNRHHNFPRGRSTQIQGRTILSDDLGSIMYRSVGLSRISLLV